ncbi:MAG TPA: hypothetical protein GX736_01425 [Mogibacterium sp.]|nr:hypothetical protein [Mogibacterium sp.]
MKKHKNLSLSFIALSVIFAMSICLVSCSKSNDDLAADSSAAENGPTIVKSIDAIDDTDGAKDLQISSITLFDDGSVLLQTKDDLKKNEAEKIYPFEESGKVKDIYLVEFGEEGYRTVVAIMENGTISAMSSKSLIEDHIAVVRDNLLGRDDIEKVENTTDEYGYHLVTAYAKDGSDYSLDFSLNF